MLFIFKQVFVCSFPLNGGAFVTYKRIPSHDECDTNWRQDAFLASCAYKQCNVCDVISVQFRYEKKTFGRGGWFNLNWPISLPAHTHTHSVGCRMQTTWVCSRSMCLNCCCCCRNNNANAFSWNRKNGSSNDDLYYLIHLVHLEHVSRAQLFQTIENLLHQNSWRRSISFRFKRAPN